MTTTKAALPGPDNPAEPRDTTLPPRAAAGSGTRPGHLRLVVGLLTFASGCGDVVALMALGGAFTSVITGNLIFVGRAVGTRSLSPALHAAIAVIGYMAGVAIGSMLTRFPGRSAPPTAAGSRRATTIFVAECCVLVAVNAVWLGYHADPPTAVRDSLLTAMAGALGMQSAAARGLEGAPSTTYMTGALTNLVMALATGRWRQADPSAAIGLVALVAGAACSAAIVTYARSAALLPPLVALALAVAVRARHARTPD
ncbi:YoaK family protein [Actinospica sp.]|uniref:YoaK family protein n=1 Tax=Actinospica sp. TaxID=1872142 RepID=UPI002C0954FB|nr:YoaK family protein [Actinospica sp.]HWG25561.1 YoaK family protein [Actinospica sp.]